jgi:KaiC/GvpD/RAD55 family RecA-like ATPase
MQRALTILKMRGVNHDRGIYRFSIGAGGIQIHERFANLEGILSGSSYHSQIMPAKKRGR